jgi:hypothetical protein
MTAEFYINKMISTIEAIDTEMLLSPELTRRLVAVVMTEMDRRDSYSARRDSDQRLDQGAQRGRGRGVDIA